MVDGDVLITGAAGLVGTALRQRLPRFGHRLRLTDNRPLREHNFIRADINDAKALADAMRGCRAVVHLAGTPREDEWPVILRLNIDGARQVFDAAGRAEVSTIIYASSIQVVGGYPADTPLGPALEPRPANLYGASKCFGELLLRMTIEARAGVGFALRICSLRDAPTNARELRTWLSPDDAARLIDRCLRWTQPGFHKVWGVSANSDAVVIDPVAEMIGYRPVDNASDHAARLSAAGIDTGAVSEWDLLAGPLSPRPIARFDTLKRQ